MDTQKEQIKLIKDLIKEDKIENALAALSDLFQNNNNLLKEISFQEGRLSNLLKNDRLGVIPYSEIKLERNQIRKAIVDLIAKLEERSIPKTKQQKPKYSFTWNSRVFLSVTATIIISVIIVLFVTKDKEISPILITEAYNAFQKKEYSLALQLYEELVQKDPNNAMFLSRRGYCYKVSNRPEKALEDYNKAIKLEPDAHQYYSNRAKLFLNLKRFKEAFTDYNKAIKLYGKQNLEYINNRGIASLGKGDKDRACQDFSYAASQGYPRSKGNFNKHCSPN